MNRNDVTWQGNFTAIVTPFKKDGAIDEAAFKKNIELLISEGIDGLVVTGCTGEFWALSDEERTRLHRTAVDVAGGRVPVIAGTLAMLTDKVVELSKKAKAAGADGVMVTPPFYILPNESEIIEHYRRVSREADIPILIYNIPKRVGVTTSPALLEKLCSIDNVVAVKQSSGSFDDVVETVRLCADKIRVFAGHSVTRGFPCVVMGTDGFVSSVETQILGRAAIDLYRLSASGNVEAARKLQYRLVQLDHAVHGLGTFPSALKAAMNLVGRPGGYPRSPIQPLSAEDQERLRSVLQSIGVL
jgi:4-hydroxy-tetrahydrodipicolinate synthase